MIKPIICQGREVSSADIVFLQSCVREHPDWSRHRISKHICEYWGWRTHTGQLKTFAARSFIDKLETREFIELPQVRTEMRRAHRNPYPTVTELHHQQYAVSYFSMGARSPFSQPYPGSNHAPVAA